MGIFAESHRIFRCSVWTLVVSAGSLVGSLAPEHTGFRSWVPGFVALQHWDCNFSTACIPRIARQILNHWTTREVTQQLQFWYHLWNMIWVTSYLEAKKTLAIKFYLFVLKYNWLTMLYQYLLYSKMTHLYKYIHFLIFFYYDLSQDVECSSLCYALEPCCLRILTVIVCVYNPRLPVHPPPSHFPLTPQCSLSLFLYKSICR